jgi:hypothetical protein
MAEVTETVCDVKECKMRNAHSFSLFSHTKSNGVDTDYWDHVFDLCPAHEHQLLQDVLSNLGRDVAITKQAMLNVLANSNIATRLG